MVDKAEATALAIGIAKLMKVKHQSNGNNNNACTIEESGELVAKHLDADFSCFLCRKKCRTRARFFLHFKRHFNKVHRSSKSEAVGSEAAAGDHSSSSSEEGDSINGDHPIHLRGLSSNKSSEIGPALSSKKRRPHFRGQHQRKRVQDQDGDSGCHSAGGGCSSSNADFSSDCPGDSESSSDSETEERKAKDFEKCFARNSKNVANNLDVGSSSAHHSHHHHSKEARERLSLAEKQLDNNETEGLVCLTCLKRFSNCQNLRRHLRLHISRDSIKPDYEMDANDSSRLDVEDEMHDGRYLCDWCPAKFDNRSAARIHESTHRGQEPKCYVCSKRYADRYSLRYHLRTHGIGRQIRCEHCNKAFSKPSRLAAHVRSHHKNIRDFACPSCDKAFKTRVHLTNHYRQHSGEKPFECPICHESFRHKASMISHSRKHDGERPYCCEICGKTFREPSTLKAHSRVHTGDKPYNCLDCGKSFTQRAGLNYHRKASHEGLRPHACRLCPFATVKAASLAAHYRNIHQGNGKEDQSDTVPLLTSSMTAEEAPSGNDEKSTTTTPLPSFDNLKTAASNTPVTNDHGNQPNFNSNSLHREASPACSITPPSSSPASSTTTSCMEDFLPTMQTNEASGSNPVAGSTSAEDYMSISELASHMEYNAYDYHSYRQQQISMYHQNNPATDQGQQHHVHHHHHPHQQQQQQQQHSMHHQQQWFGYTTSTQINDASYSYYGNAGYNNFSASNASTSGGSANSASAAAAAVVAAASNSQQEYAMGFSSNYGGYAHHPSYCI